MTYCAPVGDEESDPTLMEFLGAEMKKESGQFFKVDQHDKEEKGHFSGLGNPSAASAGARQAGSEGIQGGARCQSRLRKSSLKIDYTPNFLAYKQTSIPRLIIP